MTPLVLVGCDFRSASTRWRGALGLDATGRGSLTRALENQGLNGFVPLETCNRTDWLVSGEHLEWGAELLRSQFVDRWRRQLGTGAQPQPYVFLGADAVRHVLRVSLGLESFVMGERQVAGQLNRALERARAEGSSSPALNILGSCVGRAVRRAQRQGATAPAAAGVHALAVRRLFGALSEPTPWTVAVVGMGEVGRKVAAGVEAAGHRVHRFNRTPDPDRNWLPLDDLAQTVPELDGLVCATAASDVVLRAHHLGTWKNLVVVDVGSPAQVEPTLGEQAGLTLVDLDALLAGERHQLGPTQTALAEQLVVDGLREFRLSLAKRSLRSLVEENQRLSDAMLYEEIPSFIGSLEDTLPEAKRRALEARLQTMLRAHSRALLRAVESSLDPDAQGGSGDG